MFGTVVMLALGTQVSVQSLSCDKETEKMARLELWDNGTGEVP